MAFRGSNPYLHMAFGDALQEQTSCRALRLPRAPSASRADHACGHGLHRPEISGELPGYMS
eukprot:5506467-Heterocapsa_arctica.AAC.1